MATQQNRPSATNAEPAQSNSAGGLELIPSLADLSQPAARKRCTQIQVLLRAMASKTNEVFNLLDVAKTSGDHMALGYASWTAYVAGEYAGLLADLNRPQRREIVSSMTSIGMPSRAIATVLDVDHSTVVRDQKQVVQPAPPDREDDVDRQVTGVDGKRYKAISKPVVKPYEPRRSDLPKQYRTAVWELDKAVRRLEKLHADDRFGVHRKALRDSHRKLIVELESRLVDLEMSFWTVADVEGGCHE